MHFFWALKLDDDGNLVWPRTELAKWTEFKQIFKGKLIELQGGPLSPIRSEQHIRYTRMKIGVLCKYTGYWPEEMLTLAMEACGLSKTTGDQVDRDPDLVEIYFAKFRRLSTKRLTKEQVNQLNAVLDGFRDFWNSHKPPELWITWPERIERERKRVDEGYQK